MLKNSLLIAFLLAAMMSAGSARDAVSAEAAVKAGRAQQGNSASPAQPKSVLGIGDRLKITFFELIDVANVGNPRQWGAGSASADLQTFYQRMDLTGEYVIAEDGTIWLPRLGRFELDGRERQDLQSELAAAFTKSMGRQADVNITILERSPVYVLGSVKNPGAYKHVPGMMVLHAIALAGGLDKGISDTSQLIEGVREIERLRKTSDELKRQLAHRARLEAERNGKDTMQPSAQLISVAGEEGALVFLAAEMPGLQIEQAKRRHQLNELESAVKAARNELDALKRKIMQLDVQRDIRRERLGNLKNLMTDGLTTQTGVINIRSELSDIEARRQDSHLAVVQAEARLAQAEQALDRLPLDNAANLARAIAATETAIAEAQQSLTSSEIVGSIIETRGASSAWSRSPMTPAYEIVHRGPDGSSTTQAQETSSLLPGDILKISIRGTEPQDAGPGRREQIGLTER